jgi:2',3'-cyclic-nucleotide 2'-phosphodiesterase/3'-nucleotidase
LRVKRTTYPLLLILTALLVLALSACVRPAPGFEDQPAASPTPDLLVNPTLPLPGLPTDAGATPGGVPGVASPTPLPAVPVPVEASPTPPPVVEPPPPAPTAAPSGEIVHTVAAGENLFRIGLKYGFTAQELAAYNGIPNVNLINVGQQIRIPPSK